MSGRLKEGDRLPPEKEICEMFGVSRPTVREALLRLRADGLIQARQGAGTFVMNRPVARLTTFASAARPPRDGAIVRELMIVNQKGLHARASAKFVQTVEKFDADVRVTRGGETVGGNSIMGLMMLSAAPGTSIRVEATGVQAAEVMAALVALVTDKFGEDE